MAHKTLEELEAEAERLRTALRIYAKMTTKEFDFERGSLARLALAKEERLKKWPTTHRTNSTKVN